MVSGTIAPWAAWIGERYNVNVTVENLGPCKKLLRVEVDVEAVNAAFEKNITEVQRKARLPGFRPGKVPRDRVATVFAKEVADETKRHLIAESYKAALQEQKLHPVNYPDIEEIQFGRGQTLQFAATVETVPDFEMPEYKALPVRIAPTVVTQADQDRAMTSLREKQAKYTDVQRPAQSGDFLVINFKGTCEGKPITDLVPAAKGLTEQKATWMRLEENSFLPGFTEQLHGAQAGEHRTVTINFPANFMEAALAGKPGLYEVEVLQVKERVLPELNDEFAQSYGADNIDKQREGVARDLQNDINYKQNNAIRSQLIRGLLDRTNIELPESMVLQETRTVVNDIVKENTKRGVSTDAIKEIKEEIFSHATTSAKERVKLSFLLGRVAEKEGIKATEEEVTRQVYRMAQETKMSVEKLVKQLKERDGLSEIHDRIVTAKVLDFLQLHAKIEESAATPSTP